MIYQIYPRSFCDANGDGIGDLAGITAKLDYVASLGVDAIWLSPFFASPMKDFGYDVSDYRAVDPIFGTMEDFDRLIARAHALGLRIVIDQVYAHTSDAHAWFLQSRASRGGDKSDWYVWADPKPDGTPPNNWLSVFYGPCWTWDGRRGQYYMHNFLPSQPNLNVNNPAVQAALLEVARFWLARGVDGFRLDAINFAMHDPALTDNPPVLEKGAIFKRPFDYQHHLHNQSQPQLIPFIENLARVVRSCEGERFTVAEVGGEQALAERKEFTAGNNRLHTSYGFDFLSADKLTPELIAGTLSQWPGVAGEGWPSWAFSNHDAPRVVSRWGNAQRAGDWAKLLLTLLMSLRGNVFLYQGEELGLPEVDLPRHLLKDPVGDLYYPLFKGRDGCRTPMPWEAGAANLGFSTGTPWLPPGQTHAPLAVSEQDKDPGSALAYARRLLGARKSHRALWDGSLTLLPGEALAFVREGGGQKIACVFNLTGQEQVLDLPGPALPLDLGTGRAVLSGTRLTLGPNSAWLGTI